jgi:hypothetical protein
VTIVGVKRLLEQDGKVTIAVPKVVRMLAFLSYASLERTAVAAGGRLIERRDGSVHANGPVRWFACRDADFHCYHRQGLLFIRMSPNTPPI